jgi:hypothetical protein
MAIDETVRQKAERLWPAPEERAQVVQLLDSYGSETYEREVARVQLAIMKLSQGRLERVREMVAVAKRDYRDVLMWAEYPAEGRALWSLRRDLSAEERARLTEIRKQDREQYLAWLKE